MNEIALTPVPDDLCRLAACLIVVGAGLYALVLCGGRQ